jgi:hypothetical protein
VTYAVFFPSLMGFGILVSGALLISDLVHRALPNRGRRRRHRVASGMYGVVANAAAAARIDLPPPAFLRRTFRRRWTYGGIALVLIGSGVAAWNIGMAAYNDARGVFFESPWAFGLGFGFGVGLVALGLMAMVLAVAYRRSPWPLRWMVTSSPIGRIEVPARPGDELVSDLSRGDKR